MKVEHVEGELVVRCDDCSTKVFVIKGECLVIRSKHHGETHLTVVPIMDLFGGDDLDTLRVRVRGLS